MTITFYNFTGNDADFDKTADLGTAHPYQGTMRNGFTIMDPIIDMEYSGIFPYNYAYITETARYYFVRNRENLINGLWRITLHEDVCMSWKGSKSTPKTGIYGCYGYVTRSYLPAFSGTIPDGKYPQKANSTVTFYKPGSASPWIPSSVFPSKGANNYHYLVFFPGTWKQSGGSDEVGPFPIASVAIQDQHLNTFIRRLSTAMNVSSALTGKNFYDYIAGFMWYPFKIRNAPLESEPSIDELRSPGILSSALDFSPNNYIYEPVKTRDVTTWNITISAPGSVGKQFLCYAPYSRYNLRFMPFGTFELDAGFLWQEDSIVGTKTITVKAETDILSGMSVLSYSVDGTNYIYLGSANVAIKVPYAAASTNAIGALAAVAAGAIGVVSGNPAMLPSTASSAINALSPNVINRPGTYNTIDAEPTIIVTTNAPKDTGEPLYGFADGVYSLIGDLGSGIHIIDDVELEGLFFANADNSEKEEIKQKLKEGVHL